MPLPTFQLSTILGVATALFTGLQQAFPTNPYIAAFGAALSLIVMQEHPHVANGSSGSK